MTRALRFPEQSVGSAYLITEGAPTEQVVAQGDISVPEGAKAFLLLEDSAPADLAFLTGADGDVVMGLRAQVVDVEGLALLALQRGLKNLAIVGGLDDAAIGVLSELSALEQLDVTLTDGAGPGLVALAALPVRELRLHGDPGDALSTLARSATLTSLHFHANVIRLPLLEALASSTHLGSVDLEVTDVLDTSASEVVATLIAVATGLKSLSITTAAGDCGVAPAVQAAVLEGCPGLTFNGTSYTPAAVARLARKAALV